MKNKKSVGERRRRGGFDSFLKKNRVWLGGIAVVLLIVVVIVGIVLGNRQEPITDGYFVSDETKLVQSMPASVAAFEENEEYSPSITHIVYYYGGGSEVTGMRVYFEYENEEQAVEANANISMEKKNWSTGRRLNGKYIVFGVKGEQYSGLTVAEVRANIESMGAAGGLIEMSDEGAE